jgi:hypothetical protein
LLVAVNGQAATVTWTNTTGGTWDNVNGSYWSPATPPASNDVVNLTKATAANMVIDYAATSPNMFGKITISNSAAATTTLQVSNNYVLAFGQKYNTMNFYLGGAISQSAGLIAGSNTESDIHFKQGGTYTMTGGTSTWRAVYMSPLSGSALLDIQGGLIQIPDSGEYGLTVGAGNGSAELRQSSGTFNPASDTLIGSNGVFNLSGGTINNRTFFSDGGSSVHQTAGTNSTSYEVCVAGMKPAWSGNTNITTYTLDGGLLSGRALIVGVGKTNVVGGAGRFNQNGGTVSVGNGTYWVTVSHSNATLASSYTYKGGVIRQGSSSGTDLTVYQLGTFQGYGNGINGSGRTLNNSGRIIADGYGSAQTLDLSTFGTVANAFENTTNHGWFAVNQGKLTLPTQSVAAVTITTNTFGEATTDPVLDLVNSARIVLTSVTGGSGKLGCSLLAPDRSDVPAGLENPIGVWQFATDGFSFGSAALTFRYDADRMTALRLTDVHMQVMRHTGSAWVRVPSTVNAADKTITTDPVTTLSLYAVDGRLPRGTVVLLR